MEPEIFALARRMHEAFYVDSPAAWAPPTPWDEMQGYAEDNDVRRRWLRAAIVARPDLAEDLRVAPDHWGAGVLAVACEERNCSQPRGHAGPHFAPPSEANS